MRSLVLAGGLLFSAPAAAFTVDSTDDVLGPLDGACAATLADGSEACTLREAVAEATAIGSPYVVTVPAGTYALDAGLGTLEMGGAVQLIGAGPWQSSIDGQQGMSTVVRNVGQGTIIGFDITGGQGAGDGGGVHNSGGLSLEDVVVHSNSARAGGGIYSTGWLSMRRCEVLENDARAEGGGLHINGEPHARIGNLYEVRFVDNDSRAGGGGIYTQGVLSGVRVQLDRNTAPYGANAMVPEGGELVLNEAEIANGRASEGGGVHNLGRVGLERVMVLENRADIVGAGIFNRGELRMGHSTVQGNVTNPDNIVVEHKLHGSGGGLANVDGEAEIERSAFTHNVANRGAAIFSRRTDYTRPDGINLLNSTIAANTARADGGGLLGVGAYVRIEHSTIGRNTAGDVGGAMMSEAGTVEALSSIVAGNFQDRFFDCFNGGLQSLGHNLVDHADCLAAAQPTDIIGNPGYGPVAISPLPGRSTIPLQAWSDGLNNGDAASCAAIASTDQLHFPRFGTCERGAREYVEMVIKDAPRKTKKGR